MTKMMDTCSKWCMKCCNKSLGLLLIRIAVGAVFLIHGIQKLTNMEMTVGFFGQFGISAFFAWVAMIVETLGGLAILLGVFMVPAGILLAVTMLVAIIYVTGRGGLGGWEYNAVLLLTSLALATTGPGKYAVTDKCKMTCHSSSCGHSSCPECGVGGSSGMSGGQASM